MNVDSPFQIKKLGGKVRNFNSKTWEESAEMTAYRAVRAKFEQNTLLKNILLSTGEMVIVEASKDRMWGTGVALRTKDCLHENTWNNRGLMCKILLRVRQELRSEST